MKFEQPPNLGKTPNEIKKEVEEKGERLLTGEEYEKLKTEGQNNSAVENKDSYKAENIIKRLKLDKEKEAKIKQEIEENFKEENKLVKNDWTKTPDRLSIKKWEEMTSEEQEAEREFERKHLGARSSRI